MGDPVEVGIDMDRIHRPRNGWKFLGVIAALSAAGLLAQYICIYRYGGSELTGNSITIQAFYRQCAYTLMGLAVMAGLYFCDYSLLSRYAKAAGALFIAAVAIVCMHARSCPGGGGSAFLYKGYNVRFYPPLRRHTLLLQGERNPGIRLRPSLAGSRGLAGPVQDQRGNQRHHRRAFCQIGRAHV